MKVRVLSTAPELRIRLKKLGFLSFRGSGLSLATNIHYNASMDMVRIPYLTISKRGVLGFRRSVPPKLRPFLNKREIVHSFRTTDRDEAVAAYYSIAARVEAEIALATNKLSALSLDRAPPIAATKTQFERCASFLAITQGDASLRGDAAVAEIQYRRCLQRERTFYDETQVYAKHNPRSFVNGDRFTTASGLVFSCELTPAELTGHTRVPRGVAEDNHRLGWWYAHLLSCRQRWSRQLELLDALARGMTDHAVGGAHRSPVW